MINNVLLFVFLIFTLLGYSQIQVNAITTTESTCPNNGTITVDATSPNPPILYSIVSGPVTQQAQTNSVFNSLPAGNYTVQITDGNGNQIVENATISGEYQNPDFTSVITKPHCVGDNNGKIAMNIANGTGLAPFSWQLIAPSPVNGTLNGNTFENLPEGAYSVRVTDACGSVNTKAVTITSPANSMKFLGGMGMTKIGCDSAKIRYRLEIVEAKLPFTYSFETRNGTYVPTEEPTITGSGASNWTGDLIFEHIVPNVTYGDTITATVTNACGEQISLTLYAYPFNFHSYYTALDCGNSVDATYWITPAGGAHSTILKNPVSYTYTDIATNTIISSGSVPAPGLPPDFGVVGIDIKGGVVIPGRTYQLALTDGCGQIFVKDYAIPNKVVPSVQTGVVNSGEACMDSVVGRFRMNTYGFGKGTRAVIHSGPPTLGSTKPEYAYSDTYTWPSDTIRLNYSATNATFLFSNLAAGTYHYTVVDDCGAQVDSSFTILPSQVANFDRAVEVTKGCPGENKLKFTIIGGGEVTVKDLSNDTVLKTRKISYATPALYRSDSLLHLDAGKYEITFDYEKTSLQRILNDHPLSCWKIVDTITIPPYENPEISVNNGIMCEEKIYAELIPDTSKGVAPYQYEIYSGPETFPLQNSNIFPINIAGTYYARIFDKCNNASIKQITIDTLSFDPIELSPDCESKKIALPPSMYFSYQWLLPNGLTHIGDSLIIQPVTPSDTGCYEIARITNIDGCTETTTTSYHIGLPNHLNQTIPFCLGTTVTVGSSVYHSPGTYYDTLVSPQGCDSIVITTLEVIPQQSDTTSYFLCVGDSINFLGNYYSIPGVYTDSLVNSYGCYDLQILDLKNQELFYNHSAKICAGDSYSVGINSYNQTGIYTDTLQSVMGCDSIIILDLEVLPEINHNIQITICENESYPFAGHLLNQQGIYSDTLISANSCDSIVTLQLTVISLETNTLNATICDGEFFYFAGKQITDSGTYIDTIPTNTCDSIVVLHLTVLPNQFYHIYDTICQGKSYTFGGTQYNEVGIYTERYPTDNCDSIITLHLEVLPAPTVSITSDLIKVDNGFNVQLNASSNVNPLTYLWESSTDLSSYTTNNPTTSIAANTWVTLSVTDQYGCSFLHEYQILVPVTSTLYVPNSFTPDGNKPNNVFKVYGTNIIGFHILIFNRWGEMIFESTDFNFRWDATYNGKIVQDGTYVYKITAKGADGIIYDKAGHITVLR